MFSETVSIEQEAVPSERSFTSTNEITYICNILNHSNVSRLANFILNTYSIDDVLPLVLGCLRSISTWPYMANTSATLLKHLHVNRNKLYDELDGINVDTSCESYMVAYWNLVWALYFNSMLPNASELYRSQVFKTSSPDFEMHCLKSFANIYGYMQSLNIDVTELFEPIRMELTAFANNRLPTYTGYIRSNVIDSLIRIAQNPEVYKRMLRQ